MGSFPNYLYKEREKRFQRKKLLERVQHELQVLFSSKHEASCLKFLSMPSRPRAGHIDVISRGIHKLEELLAEMEKDEKTLKANNQAIFHNNTLKSMGYGTKAV